MKPGWEVLESREIFKATDGKTVLLTYVRTG